MINITFPDGFTKPFNKGVTGAEIASSISKSLAKEAMVVEINGSLADMSFPIENDSSIRILTSKDPEVLEIIRHDAAHIIAEAAKDLFPIYKLLLVLPLKMVSIMILLNLRLLLLMI